MNRFLAAFLGFFGGLLIYFELAMIFFGGSNEQPGIGFLLITFIGGWIASSIFIGRNARGLLHILMRGSLLGALLWIIMPISGLILGGHIASSSGEGSILGAGIAAIITGGISVALAIASLVSFAIFWLIDRDRRAKL